MIVYKLTIADSVEERILQLQDKKRELANAAIGEGDMAGRAKAAKMSMNDIMFLFKRDAEGHYGDDGALNAKTKILKERRPAPRMEPLPERQRKPSPRMEPPPQRERPREFESDADRESRRQKERESVYSRR